MKHRRTILLIMLSFLMISILSSCYKGIYISKKERDSIKMSEPSSINGRYSNLTNDTTRNFQESFWRHLKPFMKDKYFNIANTKNTKLSIDVTVIDRKKIKFSLVEDNSVLSTKIFKYKFIHNQIKITNNSKIEGIPLLFYRHRTEVIVLSLNSNHDLIMTCEGQASGGILIIFDGYNIDGKYIFKNTTKKDLRDKY